MKKIYMLIIYDAIEKMDCKKVESSDQKRSEKEEMPKLTVTFFDDLFSNVTWNFFIVIKFHRVCRTTLS